MPFPILLLPNGKHIQCDSLPTINPCIAKGYACWNSLSNCWGGILNATNGVAVPLPGELCNITLCPLGAFGQAHFNYLPSLAGNSFFSAFFVILILFQILLGFRYKTWGFLIGMVGGLGLEVAGYVGRILIRNNPFVKNPFLVYLICLTIGPAFLSASVYLCLGRIIVVSNETLSRVKPRTCAIIFICCDVISLVLQAVGGALASTANKNNQLNTGTHIMIAGLSFQVFSLLLFMCLAGEFAFRVVASKVKLNPEYTKIRQKSAFKMFLVGLPFATVCIFVRCCFRVGELSKGFGASIFRSHEVTFMVLEGAMIGAASLMLTIAHPGFAFKDAWVSIGKSSSRKSVSGQSMELSEMSMKDKNLSME